MKYKSIKYTYFLVVIFISINTLAQNKNEVLNNLVKDKNIHTVLLHKQEDPLSYPIIKLNSEEKLQLSFDDFNTKLQDYYYTIIHCNSDWTPSDLMQSEYINGFFENRIENYEFSFNTLQKYTNYQLVFPEQYLQPTLSGNYIISVFANNNPEEIILRKRFMLLDEKI